MGIVLSEWHRDYLFSVAEDLEGELNAVGALLDQNLPVLLYQLLGVGLGFFVVPQLMANHFNSLPTGEAGGLNDNWISKVVYPSAHLGSIVEDAEDLPPGNIVALHEGPREGLVGFKFSGFPVRANRRNAVFFENINYPPPKRCLRADEGHINAEKFGVVEDPFNVRFFSYAIVLCEPCQSRISVP